MEETFDFSIYSIKFARYFGIYASFVWW